MAEDQNAEDGITKLRQLVAEFAAHKKRLKARSVEIGELITAGKVDDPMLRQIVLEQFLELHDTALSLQADFAQVVLDEYETAFAEPAGDPDEEDSLLLHGDAGQLRRTTQDYRAMLEAMLGQGNYEAAAKRNIEEKMAQADESLKLIDEIEEDDGDDEDPDEDDEDDEGDAPSTDDN